MLMVIMAIVISIAVTIFFSNNNHHPGSIIHTIIIMCLNTSFQQFANSSFQTCLSIRNSQTADIGSASSFPAPCCHRPPVRDLASRGTSGSWSFQGIEATLLRSFIRDPSASTVRRAHALASRAGKKGTKPRTTRQGHSGFELQL